MHFCAERTGVTLLETLITVCIIVLLAAAIGTYTIQSYRTYAFGTEQWTAISDAQKSIATMTRELREAQQGADGSGALFETADQNIVFFSDLDDDGVAEKVQYLLEGAMFKKVVTKATGSPLFYPSEPSRTEALSYYVRNGTAPVFLYFNKDYPLKTENNPLPLDLRRQQARLIQIILHINVNPNRIPDDFLIQSSIQLRNLKENL